MAPGLLEWKYDALKKSDWKCEECECNEREDLHVHHIDGNTRNHDAENHMVLCSKCHYKLHWKLRKMKNGK